MPEFSLLPRSDSIGPRGAPPHGFHSLRATARTELPPRAPAPEPPPRRPRWLVGIAVAAVACAAAGLALVATTHEAPRAVPQVVSGTPAKKLTRNGHVERWQQREVKVLVDRRVGRLGPTALAAIERAFSAWATSGADVPQVSFEVTDGLTASLEPDGTNAIVVAPIHVPGHEQDLAVTIGFADSETGEIVESDIIINAKYPIEELEAADSSGAPPHPHGTVEETTEDDTAPDVGYDTETHGASGPSCQGDRSQGAACGARYDLESIVAHEAGHFFGLGEDDSDGLATMYYCTSQCETHKRSLATADTKTMVEVYAEGYPDSGSVQCGITGWPRHPAPGSTAGLLGLLALAALRRRVR